MDNHSKITVALSSLLRRRHEDAFVIIENPETKKFVQFTGSTTEPLMLDLPSQTLSELEFYRAVDFLRTIDVVGTETVLLDQPHGEAVSQQFSFNKVFDSVTDAAQTVEDIFAIIYEFPADCAITIIEN
ncbi:MAG: hypothetical protein HC799_12855 [Limnothrix sp. RL_2_0]|nr:hypothetical protein [Limnothrix sp. RL_2_0]